jgi:hypothetical protein
MARPHRCPLFMGSLSYFGDTKPILGTQIFNSPGTTSGGQRALVIDKEEELNARVQAGWYIKRDSKGFKVKDPQTGAEERVAADLESAAAKLYAQQKYERMKKADGEDEGKGQGIEGDYSYIVGLIRSKVDSRAPILQKWVEDILWWQHMMRDVNTKILPDLLSRLSVNEIDLEDPEKTAEAMVRHYVELRTAAQGSEAVRQKYEEELRARDEKIKALEDRLKILQDAYDQLKELYDSLAARSKLTLEYFLRQIVPYLPSDAQQTYRILASKVQQIWRGGEQ